YFNQGSGRNEWVINAPGDHGGKDASLWIVPKVNGGYPFTNLGASFRANGNLILKGSLSQASSKELKENVASLSSQEAVDILADLNPVKYNYIADEGKTLNAGFIAEEVPELITTDEHKAIKTMDVIAVLTKVVKQQQEELKTLQEEIQLLKQTKQQ
ncbi:MAG: tail fiber domain-containing protein, partial [Okeania sp. SIO2D1]|nr:tail fiber domain-containing protein [Okeania sp. SIO2D1]